MSYLNGKLAFTASKFASGTATPRKHFPHVFLTNGNRLQHKHILSFWGYFDSLSHVSLVLEYAPYGDLLNYTTRNFPYSRELRLKASSHFVRQIACALDHLQACQIAHRDIKPENIVVVSPRQVKLCDFGWAVSFQKAGYQTTLCGTSEYVPPEMLACNCKYQAAYVDSWALGVLTYELVEGESPFVLDASKCKTNLPRQQIHGNVTTEMVFDKIRNFPGFFPRHGPSQLTSVEMRTFADFVTGLMQINPESRWCPVDALEHSFLSLSSFLLKDREPPNKEHSRHSSISKPASYAHFINNASVG
jgi:serine/threonine protein kinase